MVDVSRARVGPEPTNGAALRAVPRAAFRSRFNRLKRLNLATTSDQQAFDALSQAFHGYVTRPVVVGTNGVFRARLGKPDQLFLEASELWYPPAAFVARRGRFNGAGLASTLVV